ncbi:MAG: hypothetical protein JF612_14640, partial [Planctomycetia bacterium]|nr:hypothetical protein [Planctomycetia bacterium]
MSQGRRSDDANDSVSNNPSLGGLSLLLRAFQHATDAAGDPWQFAISVIELKSKGLHDIDLTWLLNKGLAEHAIETTIPGDLKRCFRTIESRIVLPRTFYTLTKNGYVSLLESMPQSRGVKISEASIDVVTAASPASKSSSRELPRWDPSQRELHFRGQVVKRYRVPAQNQERILSAFEE